MKQHAASQERHVAMKKGTPSAQEIQAHLTGLNRVWNAALVTSDTAAAKEKGLANYRQWFNSHQIVLSLDRSGEWKIENN